MPWTRVRGHENLAAAFQHVIRSGRLGHAYLFAGPDGIGKKQFALELAKALLCEAPGAESRLEACGECAGCAQIDARTHPDFQLVGLAEDMHEFPLSLIQELVQHLSLKPARGKHRVAIIDDADQFNQHSANGFLKTLEEPPPRSLLILLSTSPDHQLPTIVSRCQVIRFAPLPVEVVADLLQQDGIAKSADEARRLAEESNGSLGDARLLADPAIGKFRRELFGALGQLRIQSVALAEKLTRFVEEGGKESAAKRQRARLAIQFVVDLLRAVLHLQQGQPAHLKDAQDLAAARALAERVPEEALLEAIERALRADYEVERRLQLVLVLEAVIDALGRRLQGQ